MDEDIENPTEPTADWLSELADSAIPSAPFSPASTYVPALDRERPARPPLVPRSVLAGVAIGLAILALLVGGAFWSTAQQAIAVPSVIGLTEAEARTTLTRENLTLVVSERRFSAAPLNEVLEQSPAPGQELRPGDAVEVVVSGGTEEFLLPDVVGQGLALASGTLEGMGLDVEVEYVLSDTASDTVLGSTPAAGATVRTGDRVRLQVSSPRQDESRLRPYRLDGVALVIDPAPPVPGAANDPALEVARRLRSLLEASGASVTMLRTGADTSTAETDRASRARSMAYAAGIGLSVLPDGAQGIGVSTVASLTASQPTSSAALASAISSSLASSGYPARQETLASDGVFGASERVWARVVLGSNASRADTTAFLDPRWADAVARAIYQALGETFGSPEPQ